jgi:SnoaL-like domain
MLSLEEISDRLEIQQLLVAYSTAIDQRRFDDLDHVFMPDAYIDYSAVKRHLFWRKKRASAIPRECVRASVRR